jgi:hemoglobin-like flavoprotein
MGNAVGVTQREWLQGKPGYNQLAPVIRQGIIFKPNFFLVASNSTSSGSFAYGRISRELVRTCESSWLKIVSIHNSGRPNGLDKMNIHIFFEEFFKRFEEIDVDGECVHQFVVHPRSYIPNRSALLLRLIKYVLSVPSDSFKVKSKLRALGRAHARRGINENHFRVFSQALVVTLIYALGSAATSKVISAWVELLSFILHQMCFDKVYFIPRAHEKRMNIEELDDTENGIFDTSSSSTANAENSELVLAEM